MLKWLRISDKLKAYKLVGSEISYFRFWRTVWVKMLITDSFREEGLKICVEALGSTDEAKAHLQRILQQAQKLRDRQEQATVLPDLGYLEHIDERYDVASKHYREALRIAEEIGDSQRVIQVRIKLGYLAIAQGKAAKGEGNFEEAEQQYQAALVIAEQIDDADLQREALKHLCYLWDEQGESAHEQGNYEEAKRLYQEALKIADEVSDRKLRDQVRLHVGRLRDDEGNAAQKQGEYEQAEQCYRGALEIAKDIGGTAAVSLQAQTHGHLGLLYAIKDYQEEAMQHLIKAIDLWVSQKEVPRAMGLTDEVTRVDEILGAETKWRLGLQRKSVWLSQKSEAALKDASQLLSEAADIFERIGDDRVQQIQDDLERLRSGSKAR